MSDRLSEQEVRHVAKLARLNCSDAEIARFTKQLGRIVEYVGQLEEVDTSDVEPLTRPLPVQNVFRQDVVGQSLKSEEALANAPQRDGEFFVVPKMLGEREA